MIALKTVPLSRQLIQPCVQLDAPSNPADRRAGHVHCVGEVLLPAFEQRRFQVCGQFFELPLGGLMFGLGLLQPLRFLAHGPRRMLQGCEHARGQVRERWAAFLVAQGQLA